MSKIKRVFWAIFNKLAKAKSLVKLKIVCLGVCVCVGGGGGGGGGSRVKKYFGKGFQQLMKTFQKGGLGFKSKRSEEQKSFY